MPTLQVMNGLRLLTDSSFLEDLELKNVLPLELIDFYKNNEDLLYQRVFGDAPKNIINDTFLRFITQGQCALSYMSNSNGEILF